MAQITKQWVDAYSPKTVADMIIPERIKQKLLDGIEDGIPNYLFYGVQGSGKTATAIALCNDLQCTYLKINASEEGTIDTLRMKIRQFASTVSLDGKPKIIIMDEMDGSSQAFQKGLRGFMNEFINVRFILTANYVSKIIPALHSRCKAFEFNILGEERKLLIGNMARRLVTILKENNIEYNVDDIKSIVSMFYPDNRKIIMETQGSVAGGKLVWEGGKGVTNNTALRVFMVNIKNKDFGQCRQWVIENSDMSKSSLIEAMYEFMDEFVVPQSTPAYVATLADWDYKGAFSTNNIIWMLALARDLMKNTQFNQVA